MVYSQEAIQYMHSYVTFTVQVYTEIGAVRHSYKDKRMI